MAEYNIKLIKKKRSIHVKHINRRLTLKHGGFRGPIGQTGISTFVRAHHGANANIPRPNAIFVEWVGTVAPINGTTEDTWIDTN